MSSIRIAARIAISGLAAAALVGAVTPAHADLAPGASDVVGVGSDIIQNSLDFLADGDAFGNPGYNTAGNKNRLISFDATADANGRNAFLDPSLFPASATDSKAVVPPALKSSTPTWTQVQADSSGFPEGPKLSPTVVLRAGTSPVQRPNGGGDGLTALLNDGGANGNLISFSRSPNLPTQTQDTTATNTSGVGALAAVQFAQDTQYIANATTTNVPSALTPAQLWWIYTGKYQTGSATIDPSHTNAASWGYLPDATGAAPATFGANYTAPASDAGAADEVPYAEVPQNGSGVLKIFLGGLKSANGGTTPTLSNLTNARQVQQNDPTTITSLPAASQPNALVPFPKGRYQLLQSGYFHNPNPIYASAQSRPNSSDGSTLSTAGITLDTGAGAFKANIPYYVIFRLSEVTSATPWQPGSTLNWVQTLFYNPNYENDPTSAPPPFVKSPAGQAILAQLGLTPTYGYFTHNQFPAS